MQCLMYTVSLRFIYFAVSSNRIHLVLNYCRCLIYFLVVDLWLVDHCCFCCCLLAFPLLPHVTILGMLIAVQQVACTSVTSVITVTRCRVECPVNEVTLAVRSGLDYLCDVIITAAVSEVLVLVVTEINYTDALLAFVSNGGGGRGG